MRRWLLRDVPRRRRIRLHEQWRQLKLEPIRGGNATGGSRYVTVTSTATYTGFVDEDFVPAPAPSTSSSSTTSSSLSYGVAQSSIDLPWRELREQFYDERNRRCNLCGEYIGSLSYSVHNTFAPHTAREGIALELLKAYHGTPEQIVDEWWAKLDSHTYFERIKPLVAALGEPPITQPITPALIAASNVRPQVLQRLGNRRERIISLLQLMKRYGVLNDCFAILSREGVHGRTWEFDRLEWAGDNVIKYLFNDRVTSLFPMSSGGMQGKLGYCTSMIDSNDGLARAYDFLNLSVLAGSDKIVSKFKSDIVEAIFGELQAFLWKTACEWGDEEYNFPLGVELNALRVVVRHTLEELAHVLVMLHVEGVRAALEDHMSAKGIPLVRTDRALRDMTPSQRAIALLSRQDYSMDLAADSSPRAVGSTRTANHRLFRVTNTAGLNASPAVTPRDTDEQVPRRFLQYAAWKVAKPLSSTVARDALTFAARTASQIRRPAVSLWLQLASHRTPKHDDNVRDLEGADRLLHGGSEADVGTQLWTQAYSSPHAFVTWTASCLAETPLPTFAAPALLAGKRLSVVGCSDGEDVPSAPSLQPFTDQPELWWDEDALLAAKRFHVCWSLSGVSRRNVRSDALFSSGPTRRTEEGRAAMLPNVAFPALQETGEVQI